MKKSNSEYIKQPTIFIDTQDIEERYGEQLYQDYLVEQNKDLQQENKQLKEKISEYQIMIAKFKDLRSLIDTLNERNFKYIFEEILKGENK